jgi:hypothetical protein
MGCREPGHAVLCFRLIWPAERIEHIAVQGITPEEVEDVCFSRPLVVRAKTEEPSPVYSGVLLS